MLTDRLYIDGRDAYSTWGVYVISGGLNELISYPPLKPVEYNDWQEEDGIEADLSAPKLDTKEISVKFAFSGADARFIGFISMLSANAYHNFNFKHIHRQYTLRMTQTPNLEAYPALGFMTIKFCDDFPLKAYKYNAPSSRITGTDDYFIDGLPFTDYGCRILKGSLAEIMKAPAVKPALIRNIATQAGATYDGIHVTFKSKDIKLQCLMRAETLDELWRNYDALLFNLTRPNERKLKVSALEQTFPCFYKKSTVSQFYPTDKIWLRFDLIMTFTRNFRIKARTKSVRLVSGTSLRLTNSGTIRKINI